MDTYTISITALACLPAVALFIYAYKKDRVEKEPISLLLLLFLFGALICYPAGELEGVMYKVVRWMFSSQIVSQEGMVITYKNIYALRAQQLAKELLAPGLIEESLKWLVLLLITRKNKNFNSLFDGLIYAISVSLGFALLENILYCVKYGFNTAVIRAITAVPAHFFFAVFMGYYYSLYHVAKMANASERYFISDGFITQEGNLIGYKKYIVLSLLLPILLHGLYDFVAIQSKFAYTVIFSLFLGILYVYCFSKIKKMSKIDVPDHKVVAAILIKKYPQLYPVLRANIEATSQDDYVIK